MAKGGLILFSRRLIKLLLKPTNLLFAALELGFFFSDGSAQRRLILAKLFSALNKFTHAVGRRGARFIHES